MPETITSIILNQEYNLSKNSNQITVRFPVPLEFKNKAIALGYAGLYYSWFNVNQVYANNSFSYIWTDGVTYPVNGTGGMTPTTIPNGNYSIYDLSNFLQLTMTANLHYALDSSGNNVYYLNFLPNNTYYGVTFTSSETLIPAGGSNPNSIPLNLMPQFLIPSNNNFGQLLGISPGTYPASQTPPSSGLYNFNSNLVPQIAEVTTINVNVSLPLHSPFNQNNSTIYQFAPNVAYPNFIEIQPQYPIFYKVYDTKSDNITISFVDQNGLAIPIIDTTSMTVTLLVADAK